MQQWRVCCVCWRNSWWENLDCCFLALGLIYVWSTRETWNWNWLRHRFFVVSFSLLLLCLLRALQYNGFYFLWVGSWRFLCLVFLPDSIPKLVRPNVRWYSCFSVCMNVCCVLCVCVFAIVSFAHLSNTHYGASTFKTKWRCYYFSMICSAEVKNEMPDDRCAVMMHFNVTIFNSRTQLVWRCWMMADEIHTRERERKRKRRRET